jgi:hypothetical protein
VWKSFLLNGGRKFATGLIRRAANMNCPICNRDIKLSENNVFQCSSYKLNIQTDHSLIYAFTDKSFILKTYAFPKVKLYSDQFNYTTGHLFLNDKKVATFKDVTFDKVGLIYRKIN